jgi:chlorobactene glucosyltransferase
MWTEIALAPTLPLAIALFNAATWRRLSPSHASNATVSVLIPARNEERRIAQAVLSALRNVNQNGKPNVEEVLVYDDDSSDGTAQIVTALGEEDPRVRLIRGPTLPSGWAGKTHACEQLRTNATSEFLVFMDADVRLEPTGIAALVSALEGPTAPELLTAVPRQVTHTFAERSVVSFLLVTYLSWLPLRLIETSPNPSFVAANGQLVVAQRESLEQIGGFSGVRGALVEDMALVTHAKKKGHRVGFADATLTARCRMYESLSEVWRGFSKNIAPGLGGSLGAIALVTTLYGLCFVWPYWVLGSGLLERAEEKVVLGGLGVLCNVALRLLTALRYRSPPEQILLHPLSALIVIAIAWNSWLWTIRRKIQWAGRTYSGVDAK